MALVPYQKPMEKKFDKKFTWVIKNFSSLGSDKIFSDKFDVRGCKWWLCAFPKGDRVENQLSLYLEVADYGTLPSGWRRHARYFLTVVNQHSEKLSRKAELQHWFDERAAGFGFSSMVSHADLFAKDSGFLVNGELNVSVELDLLDVIGKVEVKGFHIFPSQVEFVSRMFEKHPEIASEVRPKSLTLKAAYMSFLLGLIDTLREHPNKLQYDDMCNANDALKTLINVGFKLDWLKDKLNHVLHKKEKVKAAESKMQETEQQLKDLKQKLSDLEAQMEKEKAEVAAAKAPFSLDDVI